MRFYRTIKTPYAKLHLPQGKGKKNSQKAPRMKTEIPLCLALFFCGTALLSSCECSPFNPSSPTDSPATFIQQWQDDAFFEYWYTGQAELNSYALEINRYGEKRKGQALMIFVTEDMDPLRQVKLENNQESENGKINVLKRNTIWRFVTGIYDYSMMSSIFTPVSVEKREPALKLTMSSQDWCGQSFLQFNREKKGYRKKQFSYFGDIGDEEELLQEKNLLLEDDLFNLLRFGPKALPEGEYQFIPGTFFLRLSHEKIRPRAARLKYISGEANPQCVLEYLHLPRTLSIDFEANFPYHILGWTEQNDREVLVRAELIKSAKRPYWKQNKNGFERLRDSLGLSFFN